MIRYRLHLWFFGCFILLVVLSPLVFHYLVFVDRYPPAPAVLEVPQGATSGEIASLLERRSVIRSEKLFVIAVMLEDLDDQLKSGEYEIKAGMTLDQIINMLAAGEALLRKVTVPEGTSLYEISEILGKRKITDGKKFLGLAMDSGYAGSLLGTEVKSLEGYLYPDTYKFRKNSSPKEVIKAMTDRFKHIYKGVRGLNSTGLSDHEVVILASMIEKETGYDYEKRDISAVFHNRLQRGMRLECDPTAVYSPGASYRSEVTREDLRADTPYNTYRFHGLPIGPISNPSKASILAALSPSGADHLFFVSKGDGTHEFSDSYKKHLRLVNKYIRKR